MLREAPRPADFECNKLNGKIIIPATWTLGFMAEPVAKKNYPIKHKVIIHLNRDCCGMKEPVPIMLHARCLGRCNLCSKCSGDEGVLFQVMKRRSPVPQMQRVGSMWSTAMSADHGTSTR